MSCFAITYPGSGIDKLSEATIVSSDHRPMCICADTNNSERSCDAACDVHSRIALLLKTIGKKYDAKVLYALPDYPKLLSLTPTLWF